MFKKFLILMCFIFFSSHLLARSDRMLDSRSYGVFSMNNEYIYINIDDEDKSDQILAQGKSGNINLSRKKFPNGGVYSFQESKYLWNIEDKIDDYGLIYLTNLGPYLIKQNDQLPENVNDHVFSFYREGKLVRRFLLGSFCTDTNMFDPPPFGAGYMWRSGAEVDEINLIYKFKACSKEFEIDIRTGTIRSKNLPAKNAEGFIQWLREFFK